MRARLRQAVRYGHQIMVAHENDDFQVVEQWEPVTEVDVQTPREVYEELSGERGLLGCSRPKIIAEISIDALFLGAPYCTE